MSNSSALKNGPQRNEKYVPKDLDPNVHHRFIHAPTTKKTKTIIQMPLVSKTDKQMCGMLI